MSKPQQIQIQDGQPSQIALPGSGLKSASGSGLNSAFQLQFLMQFRLTYDFATDSCQDENTPHSMQ
jgi:hypothetical protein